MNEIVELNLDEYRKCDTIWDMNKCPFTDTFYKEMQAGNRIVYIYKANNEFLGEGALVFENGEYTIPNKRIYLSRLIVKKEYRNRGIGTKLLSFLINKAKALGYSEITLGVDCNNRNAMHLYRKKGFEIYQKDKDAYGEYFKMIKRL